MTLATTILSNTRTHLLAERHPDGYWVGELSSSALSTATAVFTLKLAGVHPELQRRGLEWLAATQNPDGGWGDTTKSLSNISTTALVWAALAESDYSSCLVKVEAWLRQTAGELDPEPLASAIIARYGKDHTFSVPILTMLALAGRLGPDPWRFVPQLPFELAALPFRTFRTIRLPVVSYALPALIAIGHVRHAHRPTWNPALRMLRKCVSARTLRTLLRIQPTTGGYLEATPLTSFVTMSLLGAGVNSAVVPAGIEFLARSARLDGSWPIDTNLATWATTLTVNALDDLPDRGRIQNWLLNQQYRTRHPYTDSPPGGWAWTDLSGGVPDGDDTPGALLALRKLGPPTPETIAAAAAGVRWLFGLQNRDGGIPTFCRGWGALPFDRSSTDLTAHTLRAWHAWVGELPELAREVRSRSRRAVEYLLASQGKNGAWAPLWFGNQHAEPTANLTHGTSRVLRLAALGQTLDARPAWADALERGFGFLRETQHADGGWGGRTGTPPSIEETALALEALAFDRTADEHSHRGIEFLARATANGTTFPAEPIGFYFANLWYFEKLYPAIFTAAAMRAYLARHS